MQKDCGYLVSFASGRKDRLLYATNGNRKALKIYEYGYFSGRRIRMTSHRPSPYTTRRIAVAFAVLLAFGCTLGGRQAEQADARAARLGHPDVRYQAELSPGLALALGFLPFGVGGLYVHRSGLAASGLLWPFSILWLPEMAYDAAIEVNDQAFERHLMNALERESPSK